MRARGDPWPWAAKRHTIPRAMGHLALLSIAALSAGAAAVSATANGPQGPAPALAPAAAPARARNLTLDQAAKAGLKGKPAAVWSATGTGGRTLSLDVHALQSLRLGERSLPRPFAIVQPKVGYFERADAVGFLGNAVLDKLDPFFDYANGKFGIGR